MGRERDGRWVGKETEGGYGRGRKVGTEGGDGRW